MSALCLLGGKRLDDASVREDHRGCRRGTRARTPPAGARQCECRRVRVDVQARPCRVHERGGEDREIAVRPAGGAGAGHPRDVISPVRVMCGQPCRACRLAARPVKMPPSEPLRPTASTPRVRSSRTSCLLILPGQHHVHDVHLLRGGVAHAVLEDRLDAQPEKLRHLGSAAVHEDQALVLLGQSCISSAEGGQAPAVAPRPCRRS